MLEAGYDPASLILLSVLHTTSFLLLCCKLSKVISTGEASG